MEEPHRERSQPRHGRLSEARHPRYARCSDGAGASTEGARRGLLYRRDAAVDRRRGAGGARRSPAHEHQSAGGPAGLQRAGRAVAFHQSESDRHARDGDEPHRGAEERTNGRRFRAIAVARPAVDTGGQQLRTWQTRHSQRHHGLECGRHSHAVPHAHGVSATALLEQCTRARRVHLRGPSGGSVGHSLAHVRGRHRDGPCGAVDFGVQGTSADSLVGLHILADLRRPQCRDCERPCAPETPPSSPYLVERGRHAHGASLARHHRAPGRVVVAGLGSLAERSTRARLAWRPRASDPRRPAIRRSRMRPDSTSWRSRPLLKRACRAPR